MILQALRTLQLQHSYQVVSLYVASVLFYLAGFILWNLGKSVISLEGLLFTLNSTI